MRLVAILISLIFLCQCTRKASPNADNISEKAAKAPVDQDTLNTPYGNDVITLDTLRPVDVHVPDTLIYFKQSGCFGKCPVYTLTIWEDGNVVLRGTRYMTPLGHNVSLLDSFSLEKVKAWIPRYDLPNLDDAYPDNMNNWIPDLPSSTTIWKSNGEKGMVFHNHSGPEKYRIFEKMILNWIESVDWDSSPD